MRLWPRTWFHVHRWEKLLSWTIIRYPDSLSGNPVRCRFGVRCQEKWCQELRFVQPEGSWSHTYYRDEAISLDDAMAKLQVASRLRPL